MVQIHTATKRKITQIRTNNGAQRRRTFEIRNMWGIGKISTYTQLEFQERRKKMEKEKYPERKWPYVFQY